jgi:hypothetical protein
MALDETGTFNFLRTRLEKWLRGEMQTALEELIIMLRDGKPLPSKAHASLTNTIKNTIENWCTIKNGPPTRYGEIYATFIADTFASDKRTPATLAPQLCGPMTVSFIPRAAEIFTAEKLIGMLIHGTSAISPVSIVNGGIEAHLELFLPKGHALLRADSPLQRHVLPALVNKIVSRVPSWMPESTMRFTSLDDFVRFLKPILAKVLELIETFTVPGVPAESLAVAKTAASHHVCCIIREQALEASVVTTLPDNGAYASELQNLFPEPVSDSPPPPQILRVAGNEIATEPNLSAWWKGTCDDAVKRLTVTVEGTPTKGKLEPTRYTTEIRKAMGDLRRASGKAALPTSTETVDLWAGALLTHVQKLPKAVTMEDVTLTIPSDLGAFMEEQISLLAEDLQTMMWKRAEEMRVIGKDTKTDLNHDKGKGEAQTKLQGTEQERTTPTLQRQKFMSFVLKAIMNHGFSTDRSSKIQGTGNMMGIGKKQIRATEESLRKSIHSQAAAFIMGLPADLTLGDCEAAIIKFFEHLKTENIIQVSRQTRFNTEIIEAIKGDVMLQATAFLAPQTGTTDLQIGTVGTDAEIEYGRFEELGGVFFGTQPTPADKNGDTPPIAVETVPPPSMSLAEIRRLFVNAKSLINAELTRETVLDASIIKMALEPMQQIIHGILDQCPDPITAENYESLRPLAALCLAVTEHVVAAGLPENITAIILGTETPRSSSTEASRALSSKWENRVRNALFYIQERLRIPTVGKTELFEILDKASMAAPLSFPKNLPTSAPQDKINTHIRLEELRLRLCDALPERVDPLLGRWFCDVLGKLHLAFGEAYAAAVPENAAEHADVWAQAGPVFTARMEELFAEAARVKTVDEQPSLDREEFAGHVIGIIDRALENLPDNTAREQIRACLTLMREEIMTSLIDDVPESITSSDQLNPIFLTIMDRVLAAGVDMNAEQEHEFNLFFAGAIERLAVPLTRCFTQEWIPYGPIADKLQTFNDQNMMPADAEQQFIKDVKERKLDNERIVIRTQYLYQETRIQILLPRQVNRGMADWLNKQRATAVAPYLAFLDTVGTNAAQDFKARFEKIHAFGQEMFESAFVAQKKSSDPHSLELPDVITRDVVRKMMLAAAEKLEQRNLALNVDFRPNIRDMTSSLCPTIIGTTGDLAKFVCDFDGFMTGTCVTMTNTSSGEWLHEANTIVRPVFLPTLERILSVVNKSESGDEGRDYYRQTLTYCREGSRPIPTENFLASVLPAFEDGAVRPLMTDIVKLSKRRTDTPLQNKLLDRIRLLSNVFNRFVQERCPDSVGDGDWHSCNTFVYRATLGLFHDISKADSTVHTGEKFATDFLKIVWQSAMNTALEQIRHPEKAGEAKTAGKERDCEEGRIKNDKEPERESIDYEDKSLDHGLPAGFEDKLEQAVLTREAVLRPVNDLLASITINIQVDRNLLGNLKARVNRWKKRCEKVAADVTKTGPIQKEEDYRRLVGGYGWAVSCAEAETKPEIPGLGQYLREGLLAWCKEVEGGDVKPEIATLNPLQEAIEAVLSESTGTAEALLTEAIMRRVESRAGIFLHTCVGTGSASGEIDALVAAAESAMQRVREQATTSIQAVCGAAGATAPTLDEYHASTGSIGTISLEDIGLTEEQERRFRDIVIGGAIQEIRTTGDLLELLLPETSTETEEESDRGSTDKDGERTHGAPASKTATITIRPNERETPVVPPAASGKLR